MEPTIDQAKLDGLVGGIDLRSAVGAQISVRGALYPPDIVAVSIAGPAMDFMEGSNVLLTLCKYLSFIPAHLVLELNACPYVSSMGIGGLARLAMGTERQGYRLCVVGVHESFAELLEISSLDQTVCVCPSVEEAVRLLSLRA
jgi:anti-anti-sigma factor